MDRLNTNLYVMLKFTKRPKTPGITLRKHGLLLRESAISRDFRVNLDETNADMAQFTKI